MNRFRNKTVQLFVISARCILPALLLTCIAVNQGHAQLSTGDIVGSVTDSAGAVIPDAIVTVTNTDTGTIRNLKTGQSGDFTATLLDPGTYKVRVQAHTFAAFESTGLTLSAGNRLRVDAHLTAGTDAQTVTVSASTSQQLQTDSSTVQHEVSSRAVTDLPLNGRNFVDLVQLQAGVTAGNPALDVVAGGAPDDRRQGSDIAANGQGGEYNNQLIDGLDNNERYQGLLGVRPSIDAIDQVKIFTSNYPAEVGRAAGAVVNVLTKAGTNSFHGSLFEFLRNDVFDTRTFFATTGRKPEYRENDFGGSIGGPILHNKLFFFGAVEENRRVQGITYVHTVPTLYQEQHPGDFSDVGGPVLTANQISPVSLNYFKMYPAPNAPGTPGVVGGTTIPTQNYIYSPNTIQNGRTIDARVDYNLNEKNTFFVHYGYNPVSTLVPGQLPPVQAFGKTVVNSGVNGFGIFGGGIDGPSNTTAQGIFIHYLHIFSPRLVLELKTGYTRINIASFPQNYGSNLGSAFGIGNGNLGTEDTSGVPMIIFGDSGYSALGDGAFVPLSNISNIYQYNGTITYAVGKHSFKAGAAVISRGAAYFQDQWLPAGGFFFYSGTPYGNPMANFLGGVPFFSARGNQFNKPQYRTWEPSAFAQDDWRLTPSLTLNLGVRYEIFTPFTEKHNQLSNFDAASMSVKVAGDGISNTIGLSTHYTDISPRVGFAYTRNRTVIRGGFGLSYIPGDTQAEVSNPNAPYQYVCFPCFGATYPNLIPPTVSLTNLSGAISYKDPGFQPSTLRQYSLTVEQQVGSLLFDVGYVGVQGVNMPTTTYWNMPNPWGPVPVGTPPPPLTTAATLPNVTLVDWYRSNGRSNYNSLQTTMRYQINRDSIFSMNYTWARNLSNIFIGANPPPGYQGYRPNDLNYDYGNSGIDIRHRLAGTLTYSLPFGKRLHGVAGVLGRGWQVNALGYWQTGNPFTITSSNPQVDLPQVTSDRPNQVGPWSLGGKATIQKFFNTAAFAPQTFGTLGNEHLNQLYGPRDRRLDASLFKNFAVYRESTLQFRAEFFNLTNTPNFGLPDSNLPDGEGLFGSITSLRSQEYGRQTQFALRYSF